MALEHVFESFHNLTSVTGLQQIIIMQQERKLLRGQGRGRGISFPRNNDVAPVGIISSTASVGGAKNKLSSDAGVTSHINPKHEDRIRNHEARKKWVNSREASRRVKNLSNWKLLRGQGRGRGMKLKNGREVRPGEDGSIDDYDQDSCDDACLSSVERLERYVQHKYSYSRQLAARDILETLTLVKDNREDVDRTLLAFLTLSEDQDSSVRSELVDHLVPVTMFCHQNKNLFQGGFESSLSLYMIPIILRYMTDVNNQVRKTSQASLLLLLEDGIITPGEVESQFAPIIVQLAEDEMPDDFRSEAAVMICKMAPVIGRDMMLRLFLDQFISLCSDPIFSVRKVCASNFGSVCEAVCQEKTEECLLSKFQELCEDVAGVVRKACADCFTQVSMVCSMTIRRVQLSRLFKSLICDETKYVRGAAYEALGGFIATFADPNATGLHIMENGSVVFRRPTGGDHDASNGSVCLIEDDVMDSNHGSVEVIQPMQEAQVSSMEQEDASEFHTNQDASSSFLSPSDDQHACPGEMTFEPTTQETTSNLETSDGFNASTCSTDRSVSTDSHIMTSHHQTTDEEMVTEEFESVLSTKSKRDSIEWGSFKYWQSLVPELTDSDNSVGSKLSTDLSKISDGASFSSGSSENEEEPEMESLNLCGSLQAKLQHAVDHLNDVTGKIAGDDGETTEESAEITGNDEEIAKEDGDIAGGNANSLANSFTNSSQDLNFATSETLHENLEMAESGDEMQKDSIVQTADEVLKSSSADQSDDSQAFMEFSDVVLDKSKDVDISEETEEARISESVYTVSLSQSMDYDGMHSDTDSTCSDDVHLMQSGNEHRPQNSEDSAILESKEHILEQSIVPKYLLEQYVSMMDPTYAMRVDSEITRHCAYNLPAVAYTLGRQNWSTLKNLYFALASDVQWKVRRTIACSVHEVAVIVGQDITKRDLIPVFDAFLADLDEVRMGVLQHFADFLKQLPDVERIRYLTKIDNLLKMENSRNWRFREELSKQFLLLLDLFPSHVVYQHIRPITFTLASDRVAQIRVSSVRVLGGIFEHIDDESLRLQYTDELKERFFYNPCSVQRQMFVQLCSCILEDNVIPLEWFEEHFLSSLLTLHQDAIPNVRITLARLLGKHFSDDSHRSSPRWNDAQRIVSILRGDPDRDVRLYIGGDVDTGSAQPSTCEQHGSCVRIDVQLDRCRLDGVPVNESFVT